MIIYIDFEYDQDGLISFGACAENGDSFYKIFKCESSDAWVDKNVIPVLYNFDQTHESLKSFLSKYSDIHIIADWPRDIEYFAKLIICDEYLIFGGKISFEIIDTYKNSCFPHNAYYDALSLKNSHEVNL